MGAGWIQFKLHRAPQDAEFRVAFFLHRLREFGDRSLAGVQLAEVIARGANALLVENPYIDADYRAALSRYYYLRHRELGRHCQRLHFVQTGHGDPNKVLDDLENRRASTRYLGNTVIRPTPDHCLGRTVLSSELSQPPGHEHRFFVTCAARNRVNLGGVPVEFPGAPWIQQDQGVAACASAAMWVAGTHLCHRFSPEFGSFSTAQITDLATRDDVSTGRSMPSNGLTNEQVLAGFEAMGIAPSILLAGELGDAPTASDAVYRHIESSLPVVLGLSYPDLGGHAVTVIGHSLSTSIVDGRSGGREAAGSSRPIWRASDYVPSFLAQDDAGGPFRTVEFITVRNGVEFTEDYRSVRRMVEETSRSLYLERTRPIAVVLDRAGRRPELAYLNSVILPAPSRVVLSGESAERAAIGIVASVNPGVSLNLLYRSFLLRSNELKAECRSSKGMPDLLAQRIRYHLMPKWVWVTEFAEVTQQRSRLIAGMIVHDAGGHSASDIQFDLVASVMPKTARFYGPGRDDRPDEVVVEDYCEFLRYERGERVDSASGAGAY